MHSLTATRQTCITKLIHFRNKDTAFEMKKESEKKEISEQREASPTSSQLLTKPIFHFNLYVKTDHIAKRDSLL